MRAAMLMVITFLQIAACPVAMAGTRSSSPAVVAQAGLEASRGIQSVQGSGGDMTNGHADVAMTLNEPMHERSWYDQSSRIAVLALATVAVLSLLAMVMRRSRTAGATIAK